MVTAPRDDGYIAPLTPRTRALMAELWHITDRGPVLSKYQLLLVSAERQRMDLGVQPYQNAKLLIELRNALVHYQPESVESGVGSKPAKNLHGKFAENALMAGADNGWWPDHALGAGCAQWAVDAAEALADAVSDAVGIRPNYRRVTGVD